MKKSLICSVALLILNAISYANIYQVPLDVNGYYEFSDSIWFNLDLGTSFQEIHDVRFNCNGDVSAIAAPGLFECTLIAGTTQWLHAYTDVIDFNPDFTPFICNNISFIHVNGATWDFLLDGTASGYVRLITNMMYIPENPPNGIYGNIYSASLTIDATPVPEPASMLFLTLGGLTLLGRKRK